MQDSELSHLFYFLHLLEHVTKHSHYVAIILNTCHSENIQYVQCMMGSFIGSLYIVNFLFIFCLTDFSFFIAFISYIPQ